MVDKISVQIALEGGDEVEKQLAAIGEAGDQAFAGVNEAGTTAAEGIAKAGEAADKTSESVHKLSLESVKTGAEIAKLGAEIAKIGVEIGLTIARHRSWVQQLLHLSSTASTAVRALALLSPELTAVATAAAPVALAIGGGVIALEALRKATEAAAGPLAKLSEDLTRLSRNTGETFVDLQQRTFADLQQGKAAFEQLGIGGENFASIITKINEVMKDFDVGAKIKESADNALKAEKELLEAQLKLNSVAVIGAEGPAVAAQRLLEINQQLTGAINDRAKVEEAERKLAKANANDLQAIIPIIEKIVAGTQGLKFDSLTTAATKIDALTAAMKKAEDRAGTAGEVLVRFIANADRASGIEIGAKFGLTEDQVDRLQRTGGQLRTIDEIWKRIQSAGVLIPPESAAAFERLRREMDATAQAKARFDKAMATSLPATFAAEIASQLEALKAKLINMASTDVETLSRALTQLGGKQPFTNTIRELETIGRLITLIGGQTTSFSWGELVATGGLASTRQELEAIGGAIMAAWERAKQFNWGSLLDVGSLAATWRELETIGGVLAGLIDKLLIYIGLRQKVSPIGQGGIGHAAHGGLIGGRGTGTSDSNLAWVSRGEYITPARAVGQPGVFAFLEALRRSGGNLSRVLDGMGRFALGGLVPRSVPAFASGGPVGGMSHVTIQFPGLPDITGLRASSGVVDQLHKAAALAQVRSGGRKPSRYS